MSDHQTLGDDVYERLPHLREVTKMELAALMHHVKYDVKVRDYLRYWVERYEVESARTVRSVEAGSVTQPQRPMGQRVESLADAQPGDVVHFQPSGELEVQKVIQRAVDEDCYTNPPGARLPGSAVLKALRELDPETLASVLWPA